MSDKTKYLLSYGSADNAIVKCTIVAWNVRLLPGFARIHALRRLRCRPCRAKRPANGSSVRQCSEHSLMDVTTYLVIDRIKVGAIQWPQVWRNKSGCWLLKKSHSVACPVCRWAVLLGRPTYMSADLRFTTDSSSSSSFSSATLCARWTELNQNQPHARKWVRFENACPKSGVSYPLQIRGPNPPFWRLHNLTATLTAHIQKAPENPGTFWGECLKEPIEWVSHFNFMIWVI